MKTEEDEAFEAIERRQGGFQAKRAMAADKFIAAEERKVNERYGYVPKLHPSEWMGEPAQEPVAHLVIAGALYDFMGWLTSRKERIVLSSADNASPAADAIRDFANMRGLFLDDAQVETWREALAQPAQEPVAYVTGMSFSRFIVEPLNPAMVLPVGMALYSAPQGNK